MKNLAYLFLCMLIILMAVTRCNNSQTNELESLKQKYNAVYEFAAPPPAILDSLYPPNAEVPVYLFKMFEMATSMDGIFSDLMEKDLENAMVNYERFKVKYFEVSKLVPEWEKKFPSEIVEDLGKALESGAQEQIMGTYEKLGKVCHDCHIIFMPKVQHKYHWKDFSVLKIVDPITEQETDFILFMRYLSSNFNGMVIDLEQGQIDNAQKHFQAFNARFKSMEKICVACHMTKRKYYIGEVIQPMIDNLELAISELPVDMEKVAELAQGIGIESCYLCHVVHIPAGYSKYRWGKLKEIREIGLIE